MWKLLKLWKLWKTQKGREKDMTAKIKITKDTVGYILTLSLKDRFKILFTGLSLLIDIEGGKDNA